MLWGVKWYLWLILVIAIIVAVFAWHKALTASRERREKIKREGEIWKRDYDLRQKFSVLTDDKIKETADADLLHGVAMNIQVALTLQGNRGHILSLLRFLKTTEILLIL